MDNIIGHRLKIARSRAGMSLRDLAQKAGLSAQAISKYERGLDTPSSRSLLRLAGALDLRVEYFFRSTSVNTKIAASFRAKKKVSARDQKAMMAKIQDWLERYCEVESLFGVEGKCKISKKHKVNSPEDIEAAAAVIRGNFSLGTAPVLNLIEILEEKGIKVWRMEGHGKIDSCTFETEDGSPVIVINKKVDGKEVPGDRQLFSVCHELGHLYLQLPGNMSNRRKEALLNRFAGAFLVPKEKAIIELGNRRTGLDFLELHILKHKYGLSVQGWIHRAEDLNIIGKSTARKLFGAIEERGWREVEPGDQIPPERPKRMLRMVFRALEEGVVSRSRANELLGEELDDRLAKEKMQHGDLPVTVCR